MTKLFLIQLILSGMLFSPTTPAKLKVVVKNIQVGKGSVVVDIYRKETFLKKAMVSKREVASGETLEFIIDLTEGEYAVAIYQDINDNKVLDRGMFGIPKEPAGLSNNFQPKFSAPGYDDCKFYVSQQTTITILLN